MKKILFVVPSLGSGGAEKSFISLINLLPQNEFDINIMVVNEGGMFYKLIPTNTKRIEAPENLKLVLGSIHNNYFKSCKKKKQIIKILFNIFLRLRKTISSLDTLQFSWKYWKNHIPILKEKYDIAISYMNGITNYYVIDKVQATQKILWVHNDYNKLEADKDFDNTYFEKADKIITISNICVNSLIENFPLLNQKKIKCIPNLSSGKTIKDMSNAFYPKEYTGCNNILKIISIGRLEKQKGFDIAVKAAKHLKDNNINFKWFIIGIGSQKEPLINNIIENGLSNNVYLLGERINPYPYIKNADIFVQSSRYEGKSIVLDEAMILGKPIVVTNYPTVTDSVENYKTALIVNINDQDIYKGITELINNKQLNIDLCKNLKCYENGNEELINLYLEIIK